MKMTAAVMFEQGLQRPFAQSLPLRIETVDLDGPGEGEVLVQIAAPDFAIRISLPSRGSARARCRLLSATRRPV